jgi:hypothetical protein
VSVKYLYPLAIAAIIGCSSNPSDTPGGRPAPIRTNVLTAEEMANTHADVNTAYDAVQRLRSNWLAPHGAASSNSTVSNYASVFVDGQAQGDVNALKGIPAYYVAEIRYYDVTQAGAKFGVRAGTTGAIEVSMKKP